VSDMRRELGSILTKFANRAYEAEEGTDTDVGAAVPDDLERAIDAIIEVLRKAAR
jgi:hypothetical protein